MAWRRSSSTPRRSPWSTEGYEERAWGRWRADPARGRDFRRAGARFHSRELHDRRHEVVLDRVGDDRGRACAGRARVTKAGEAGLILLQPLRPAALPKTGRS